MKALSLGTLTFLLHFVLLTSVPTLGISEEKSEIVVDAGGQQLFPGYMYYVIPDITTPSRGGGLKLSKTGNSTCPVTILQQYSKGNGIPVKFTILGYNLGIIATGIGLKIEFLDNKPACASSSKWCVIMDKKLGKKYVGIGGPEDHRGQQMFDGHFAIQKLRDAYKLTFCKLNSSTDCTDIGRFDNKEGGNRLYLTDKDPLEVRFHWKSSSDNGII